MVAEMTGSGKAIWFKHLLQQAQRAINLPPERIVWCYSQWLHAYLELVATILNTEFVRGIPSNLEHNSYFDIHKRNLTVIDDQMIWLMPEKTSESSTCSNRHLHRTELIPSRKRQSKYQLKQSILDPLGNPRDKLQILTLANQTYPGHTDFFINRYEQAVQRPFGYLLVALKTTTQDNCRIRKNVLPGEERFDNIGVTKNISQERVLYLKQQNLMTPPVIPCSNAKTTRFYGSGRLS